MTINDLVSIIIPIYNGEKWLKESVSSAMEQSYKNIEIILVDDGSTDKSLELCHSFEYDNRIRVIHKSNGGQASARNVGLKEARGKYIQFLDCDDTLELGAIEIALNFMGKDVDMVLFGLNIFNNKKLLRTPHTERLSYRGEYELFKKWSFLMASPCNKLYKKTYITHMFQEECVYGEDGIFNYSNFSNKTHVECVENCLYNVNLDNPQSVNKRYKQGRLSDTIKSILLRLKKISAIFGTENMLKDYFIDSIKNLCFTIRLVGKKSSYRQFCQEITVAIYSNKECMKLIELPMKNNNWHSRAMMFLLRKQNLKLLFMLVSILNLKK